MKVTYTKEYVLIGPYTTRTLADIAKSEFDTKILKEISANLVLELKNRLLKKTIASKATVSFVRTLQPLLKQILVVDYLSYSNKNSIKIAAKGKQFYLKIEHIVNTIIT